METPPDEKKLTPHSPSDVYTPSVSRDPVSCDPVSCDPASHDECDSRTHEDSHSVDSICSTKKKKKHHRHKKSHRAPSSSDSAHDLVTVSSRCNILSDPLHICLGLPFPARPLRSKSNVGSEIAPEETVDPELKGLVPESERKLEDELDFDSRTPPETGGQDLSLPFVKSDDKLDGSDVVKMADEPELLRENELLAAMLNDLVKFLEETRGDRACLEDSENDGESKLQSPEPSKGQETGPLSSPSSHGVARRTSTRKSGASATKSPTSPKSSGPRRSSKSPTKRPGKSSGKTGGEKLSTAPMIRFSTSASSLTLLSTESTDNSKNSGEPESSKPQDQFYSESECLEIEPLGLQSGESSGEPSQICHTAPPSVDDENSSHPKSGSTPSGSASKLSCWREMFRPMEVVSRYIQTDCWNEPSDSSAPEVTDPPTAAASASKNSNEACCLQVPTLDKRGSEESSVEEFDRIFASYAAAKDKERARTDVKAVVRDNNFNSTASADNVAVSSSRLSLPAYDERYVMAQSGSA
ncbi:unnamed protein product [Ixodes hexagonus]